MVSEKAVFPAGARLAYPDGSVFVWMQASEDLEAGSYVEPNANLRLQKYKGRTNKFPPGIVQESVPKEWWTFVLVRDAVNQSQEPKPVVG